MKKRVTKNLRIHYNGLVDEYVSEFFNDLTDAPWIDRLLGSLPARSCILDVGCGPGNFSAYIASRGHRVTGIDISTAMIERARMLVPTGDFRVMNMSRLRFSANSFDGLLVAYSFLHVPKRHAKNVLHEFCRVLKPRGVLALMVKEGTGHHNLPSPLVAGRYCFVELWREETLSQLLKETGFDLILKDSALPKSLKELPYRKFFFLMCSAKRSSTGNKRNGS